LFSFQYPRKPKKAAFWFATGGAGVCLSRPLAERMAPLVSASSSSSSAITGFESAGEAIRLPDDVTLGYISEHVLGVPLTPVAGFHSHLEPLRLISEEDMREHISFSYSLGDEANVLSLEPKEKDDETRFFALHCLLFPASIAECQR